MEFRPAHTAWQDVQTKGFRTFLKYHGHVSELFVNARDKQMLLGANSLMLQCRETDAPVRAQVQYFILPNACVGALARALTIENTGNGVLDLEVLDGLPAIVPYGIGDWHLKCMTQTARAWMETVGGETGVPRYRVRASLEDSARVEPITGFAFGFSCVEEGKRLPVLWDPEAVFGQDTSFAHPHGFARMDLPELISAHQRPIRKLAERFGCGCLPLVSHFSRKCRMDPGGEIGRQTRRLPVLAAFDRPRGISVGCLIAVQF